MTFGDPADFLGMTATYACSLWEMPEFQGGFGLRPACTKLAATFEPKNARHACLGKQEVEA